MRSFVRRSGEAPRIPWIGGDVALLAAGDETGDRYTVEIAASGEGGGPAPHLQAREDEFFFVLSGGPITYTAGNQAVDVSAGGFITISSGTAHQFKNNGRAGRLITFNAPAGFDRFQRQVMAPWVEKGEAPPPMPELGKRIAEVAPSFGITMFPDEALFEVPPVVHSVAGDAPADELAAGVNVTVLAEAKHTGGRYAVARARLSAGALPRVIGHRIAATGLIVLEGKARFTLGGLDHVLEPEDFAHIEPGDDASIGPADAGDTSVLVWHAPALGVPFSSL
ncbi:MAG: cupin domain-containing protein [Geminicoccaceae bacterium]